MKKHDLQQSDNNLKWNKFFFISAILAIICFAGIIIICKVMGHAYDLNYLKIQKQEALPSWTVLDENENPAGEIVFPADYQGKEGEPLIISTPVPSLSKSDETTLKLQFLHMKVSVYIDETLIYEYGEGKLPFSHTTARAVHFLDLPYGSEGHDLKIHLTPCLSGTQVYRISTPEIGTHFSMLAKLLQQEGMAFAGAFVLAFAGICILIFGFFIKKMAFSSQAVHLGIFSLLSGAFSFCETELALLMTGNPYLIHVGDAVSLILLCFPFLALLSINCGAYLKKPVRALAVFILCSFIFQNILNFAGWDYRYFVMLSHIICICSIAVLAAILCMAAKRRDKNTVLYVLSYIPIALGAVIELLNFYITAFPLQGFFFELGIFVFILLHLRGICRTLIQNYQEAAVSRMYRKMAFTDNMTGLPNRTAYQMKMDVLCGEGHTPNPHTWCVMADINQLKMVNDTMGHRKGDALIIATADALKKTFDSKGDIFRIGGDEFAVIIDDCEENEIRRLLADFRKYLKEQEAVNDFPVQVAIGSANYDARLDQSLEQTFIRADNRMYDNKRDK